MDMGSFSNALVLFAHPDDAEFMCGGTVAKWAGEGPGASREAVAPVREREQRAAAAVLGVKSVTFLGEPDGLLEVNPSTRKKVCREVRRLRPEVLLAPDPSRLWFADRYINHWDHKQAGMLALTAVMPDGPTRVMFQELEQEGLEPFAVPNLWLGSNEPDTIGQAVSSGCIRMTNEDVIDLYERAKVGANVVVLR